MIKFSYYKYISLIIDKVNIKSLYKEIKGYPLYYNILSKKIILKNKFNKLIEDGLKVKNDFKFMINELSNY